MLGFVFTRVHNEEEIIEIRNWLDKCEIEYAEYGAVINPETFETLSKWQITNEEHCTMFYLKWGK